MTDTQGSSASVDQLIGYWLTELADQGPAEADRAHAIEARWKGGMRKLTRDEADSLIQWKRARINAITTNTMGDHDMQGVFYRARQDDQALDAWLEAEGF